MVGKINPDHTLYSYWSARFKFALPHNQGVLAEDEDRARKVLRGPPFAIRPRPPLTKKPTAKSPIHNRRRV